jgi:hypothetical protein
MEVATVVPVACCAQAGETTETAKAKISAVNFIKNLP